MAFGVGDAEPGRSSVWPGGTRAELSILYNCDYWDGYAVRRPSLLKTENI